MPIHPILLSALLLAAQPAAAAGQAPVVLACEMPAKVAVAGPAPTTAHRLFRVGPGLLQEWDAGRKAFGSNLCAAFSCVKTAGKSEGNISSASAGYTVGVADGKGYWRAVGATGSGARSGTCRIVSEPMS